MDLTLLEGIGLQNGSLLSLPFLVKLILLAVLVGYLVYSFLLTLRIRILDETLQTRSNSFVRMIAYAHLFFALIGTFFAVILILLG
jgi:hypothetical protein